MLSNLEIHRAIDEGRLIITPEPQPRLPLSGNVSKSPYSTCSVDLRLSEAIVIPTAGAFAYDLTQPGSLTDFLRQTAKKVNITPEQPFHLTRNQFILARTIEHIELPLDCGTPILGARIEGKSSLARCGLLVHFTAPTVHPGFKGTLTLEIINLGWAPITLHPGMAIAQLILEELKGEVIDNPSQFHGQSAPEGIVKKTQ